MLSAAGTAGKPSVDLLRMKGRVAKLVTTLALGGDRPLQTSWPILKPCGAVESDTKLGSQ